MGGGARTSDATATATGWSRPTSARLPTGYRFTRSWPPSPALSTASASRNTAPTCPRPSAAMLNYYERYQPDVVLAYNDLAKEAEAFGCRVKYSDYVVPSIDAHVLPDDKDKLGRLVMPDPYATGAAARIPRAVRGARQGQAAGGHRRGGGWTWTIAMLFRNPETMLLDTFEDPQFIHDLMQVTTDFCKLWGDAIVKTGIGLSFSEPTASISLISPDNYREFIAPYHRELVEHFKAKKVGVTTHICGTTYPDLRGPDPVRLHHGVLRPRSAGRSRPPRRPATAVHGGSEGAGGGHRQRRRHAIREDHPGGDGSATSGAASTPPPGTPGSSSRPRARSLRVRTLRRSSGSCTPRGSTVATIGSFSDAGRRVGPCVPPCARRARRNSGRAAMSRSPAGLTSPRAWLALRYHLTGLDGRWA